MKKLIWFFSFLFFIITTCHVTSIASTGEEILYKYGTTDPVTYYNTSTPVYLPTNMNYAKQEFRGVWITTIWNLDVPKHTSKEQYQLAYKNTLDLLESYNMNVILYQVRPKNDAMYESALNPWSRFMTGTEGVSPGWDPLPWMIEETHKRGMEFHAWFNPYRVFVTGLSENNFANKHPEYVLNIAAGEEILNPGEPAVQQFVIDTVMEVVNKYDIDGVHFDDYFYPYGGLASTFDANEFKLYNPNKLSLDNWRRENVNHVIKTIKQQLTTLNTTQNRSLKLGMSPFGVWANKTSQSLGSNTKSGVQSYSELYADSYRWVKEEWIDYIVPQSYWEFTDANAPYADVVKWWADVTKGTDVNLFTGQSIYRYKESGWNTGPWANPDELGNQLLYNSKFPEITGSVYFRLNYFKNLGPENLTYAQTELKNNYFQYKVLPPAFKNVDSTVPNAPSQLAINQVSNGNQLTWTNEGNIKANYIYRFNEHETVNLNDISKVIDIVWTSGNQSMSYIDATATVGMSYNYYITSFDQAYNESAASTISNHYEEPPVTEPPVTPPPVTEPPITPPPVTEPPVEENPDEQLYLDIASNITLLNQFIDQYELLYQQKLSYTTFLQDVKSFGINISNNNYQFTNALLSYQDNLEQLKVNMNALNQLMSDLEDTFHLDQVNSDILYDKIKQIENNQSILMTLLQESYTKLITLTELNQQITNELTQFKSDSQAAKINSNFNYDEISVVINQLTAIVIQLNEQKTQLNETNDSTLIHDIDTINLNYLNIIDQFNDLKASINISKTTLNSLPSFLQQLENIYHDNSNHYEQYKITIKNNEQTYNEFDQQLKEFKIKLNELNQETIIEKQSETKPGILNFNLNELDPTILAAGGAIALVFILFIVGLKRRL